MFDGSVYRFRWTYSGRRSFDAGEPLKGLFAYVPQNNEVFEGSLFDNIALGRRVSPDCVRAALEISGLIKSRDDLDLRSKLGEEGIKLSGGEIQRLGLLPCLSLESRYFGLG